MIGWPGTSGPSSQPSKSPKSSEHSNSAGSDEANRNAAVVLVVDAGGPETIVVSGRLASTVHDHSSGVVSTTPNGRDRADLEDVLAVGQPGAAVYGFAHGSELAEVERALERRAAHVRGEGEVRGRAVELALGADVDEGLRRLDDGEVAGRAGVGSTLTTRSFGSMRTERTRKMCGPSARPEYCDGDSHSLNASPSIAHSNVAAVLVGDEREGDRGVSAGLRVDAAGDLGRAVRDLRVQADRRDDAPLPRGDRRVDHGLLALEHAHLELVRAERQAVVGLRREAGRELAAVEGALVQAVRNHALGGELEAGGAVGRWSGPGRP